MKITWEVTGKDWIGFKIPFFYKPLRWLHEKCFPSHPDYNGGDF